MIRAKRHPMGKALLTWFFIHLLRSHFQAIYAADADQIRQLDPGIATIGYANHTNWWDGPVLIFLTRLQPHKAFYCMMEEKQMRHYPFFSWIGAFSVDLQSRTKSAASVRYALKCLKNPATFIWIFPQGAMVKETDPIEIKRGADFLAHKRSAASLLPVFFRFRFRREQKPEIFIRFGTVYPAHENSPERMKKELTRLGEQIDRDLSADNLEDYECLMKPRLSVNKWWELVSRLMRGKLREFESTN